MIEEPEAHIHAQRQLKLIQSLEEESEKGNRQTIITTHSPLLASVVKLSNIVIVKSGKVYSLEKEQTKLDEDEYLYLEKYLDAIVVTDMDGKQLVIDCKKAEVQVVFDEPEDAGILARFAREEPAGYVSMAMRPGGLQDYVDVWNELN